MEPKPAISSAIPTKDVNLCTSDDGKQTGACCTKLLPANIFLARNYVEFVVDIGDLSFVFIVSWGTVP